MKLMTEKVALVTGGSSGIGRATAIAFAKEGANVVVAARNVEAGEETINLIKEVGGNGLFIQTDISKSAEVQALIEKTVASYGQLDYAFNNAGIEGNRDLLADTTEELYDRIMDTNVKGVWLAMKYELAQMLKQGSGAIVNNASMFGSVGRPDLGVYSASKHAVIGLTKTAALEYAKSNIRVNAVSPGGVQTPMIDRFVGEGETEMRTNFAQIHPLGRLANPEEIANATVWLCSNQASFVTGHALAVDGGWTAQ
jgi:NAD(P)-dependent dehydrogenase (short-subunit alcohol dehydrogenase family)